MLFDWRSLDHVALAESHQRIGPRFDYFHANSIGLTADGNLLVCARNTWAAYKIDRDTGRVIWRLGGKKSDFRMGKGTFFAWQHDARLLTGASPSSLRPEAAGPETGFETLLTPFATKGYAVAVALDDADRPLGRFRRAQAVLSLVGTARQSAARSDPLTTRPTSVHIATYGIA